MSDNPNRRAVLKAAGSIGAVSGVSGTVVGTEADSTKVIEAGVRYELPDHESYKSIHIDSRPSYTVDRNQENLILLKRISKAAREEITKNPVLADEVGIGSNGQVSLGPEDGVVRGLPMELSGRMRIKNYVSLAKPVEFPNIVIHTRGDSPAANIESQGEVRVTAGERTRVELDPVTVTADTEEAIKTTGDDGTTQVERKTGTVQVQATPVLKLVNHGELAVKRQA